MRFVFPVLVNPATALPVEIIPARAMRGIPGSRILEPSEIDNLELEAVWIAAERLGIPLRSRRTSWSVATRAESDVPLHGPSAQLAALVAATTTHCRRKVRPRGWLNSVSEVWATAALRVHDLPIQPGLAALADDDFGAQELQVKARSFIQSSARVLLMHVADVARCQSMLSAVPGLRVVDLPTFRSLLTRTPDMSVRFVVGVESHELLTVLEALFTGLVLRNLGAVVANIFTGTRLVLGGFTAWQLINTADFTSAAILYLFGLGTDVADGEMARRFQGTSEFGKKFDRWVDIGFNGTVGLGFIAGSILNWGTLFEATLFFSLTGALVALTYPIVDPRCTIPKLRSGWIRVVILAFLAYHVRIHISMVAMVSLCMLALTLIALALYEVDLLRRDLVGGRRVAWVRFQPWLTTLIRRICGHSA